MRVFLNLLCFFLITAGTHLFAADGGTNLELWLRRGGSDPKGNLATIDVKGLTFEILSTYDIQYEADVKVRGMHLRDLIAIYKPIPEGVDVINLYTKAGMIVPISLAKLRKDIQVFIAFEIFKDGKWTPTFPSSVFAEAKSTRQIPTTFAGNKIVVGKEWRGVDSGFTPWRHLDTLVGIEFVESQAYAEQFRNSKSKKSDLNGRLEYLANCQYCHGVLGLGATRAPAFTNLIPLYTKDAAEKFYKQAKAPGAGGKLPHFMPAQANFSKRSAKALVSWLDGLKAGELTPYQPSYQNQVTWK